jgi:hypothetical protein
MVRYIEEEVSSDIGYEAKGEKTIWN